MPIQNMKHREKQKQLHFRFTQTGFVMDDRQEGTTLWSDSLKILDAINAVHALTGQHVFVVLSGYVVKSCMVNSA